MQDPGDADLALMRKAIELKCQSELAHQRLTELILQKRAAIQARDKSEVPCSGSNRYVDIAGTLSKLSSDAARRVLVGRLLEIERQIDIVEADMERVQSKFQALPQWARQHAARVDVTAQA